jgi:hypothetical protein
MGGEDTKLMFLREAALSDFVMNSICAAGPGSFLDQQARRINVSIVEEFGRLALLSCNPPRIAGRGDAARAPVLGVPRGRATRGTEDDRRSGGSDRAGVEGGVMRRGQAGSSPLGSILGLLFGGGVVDDEDRIEMVDLVLAAAGEDAGGLHLYGAALFVLPGDHDPLRSLDGKIPKL